MRRGESRGVDEKGGKLFATSFPLLISVDAILLEWKSLLFCQHNPADMLGGGGIHRVNPAACASETTFALSRRMPETSCAINEGTSPGCLRFL